MKKTIKDYIPKAPEEKEQIFVRLSKIQKKNVVQAAGALDMSTNSFVILALRYFVEQGLSKSFDK